MDGDAPPNATWEARGVALSQRCTARYVACLTQADEVRKSARRGTGPDAPVPSAEQVAKLAQQVLDQLLHAKDADLSLIHI